MNKGINITYENGYCFKIHNLFICCYLQQLTRLFLYIRFISSAENLGLAFRSPLLPPSVLMLPIDRSSLALTCPSCTKHLSLFGSIFFVATAGCFCYYCCCYFLLQLFCWCWFSICLYSKETSVVLLCQTISIVFFYYYYIVVVLLFFLFFLCLSLLKLLFYLYLYAIVY